MGDERPSSPFTPTVVGAPELLTLGDPRIRRSLARRKFSEGTLVAGRYEIRELLGEGGFGEVYRVADKRGADRELALKLHPIVDVESLEALKAEFALLSTLSHPHLARVYDFEVAGDCAFFTQSIAVGRPFDENLGLSLEQPHSLELIAQLCRALEYLHSRGILHRDLKADNILVDTEAMNVTLLDFGIARLMQSVEDPFAGTPAYAAPEMIRGGPLDARTDLYALGVCLYRQAAGTLPFTGSPRDMVVGHLDRPVPDLPEAIPSEIAAVVLRMLSKDPADRYASAGEVLEALTAAAHISVPLETQETLSSYVLSASYVGGQHRLATLRSAMDRNGLTCIVGEAGNGKSRLLREMQREVQLAARHWVAVAPLRDPEASLIQDLASSLLTPDVVASIGNADRLELARLVPDLLQPGEHLVAPVSPQRARRHRIRALARAIRQDARGRSLVIAIEDLHRARENEVEDLLELVGAVDEEGARCTFIAASRPGPVVDRLSQRASCIPCATLSPAESRELIASMFGAPSLLDGSPFGQAISSSAHSAFWIVESIRLALENGSIIRQRGQWYVYEPPPDQPLERVLAARLERLSPDTRKIALASAVLARRSSLVEIARTVGRTVRRAAGGVQDLLRSAVIEDHVVRGGTVLYQMHDRFAEVILSLADPEDVVDCHHRAGRLLTRKSVTSWRQLARGAEHLVHAGYEERALDSFRRAALRADTSGRPDVAASLLDRASRLGDRPDIQDLLDLHDFARKAGATDLAGDALSRLLRGRRRASRSQRVLITLNAARADALDHLNATRARRRCARALATARRKKLQREICEALLTRAEIEVHFGNIVDAADAYQKATRRADRIKNDLLLQTRARLGIVSCANYLGETDTAYQPAQRAVKTARRHGDPALLSEALRHFGSVIRERRSATRGDVRRSVRLYRQAVEVARSCGASAHEAKALNNLGIATQWLGNVDEASEALQRAIELKEAMGQTGSKLLSMMNLGQLYAGTGMLNEARTLLMQIVEEAPPSATLGVATAVTHLGDLCAHAEDLDGAMGHYEHALELQGVQSFSQQLAHTLLGIIRTQTMRGELPEAERHLQRLEEVTGSEADDDIRYGRRLHALAAVVADARGRTDEALAECRIALGKRRLLAMFWGSFGNLCETTWLEAVLLARLGQMGRSRQAVARSQKLLREIAGHLRPEQRERFLNAYPAHRAILVGDAEAVPAGWTWTPGR